MTEVPSRLIELPVKYGGRWGPDLDFVAKSNTIPPRRGGQDPFGNHSLGGDGGVYTRLSPAYAARIPPLLLSVPKYTSPRIYTPKGTVALGGSITAIYPVVSPGGYQMMGITPVPIYDRYQSLSIFEKSPVLLRIGDRIKFVPVDLEECDYIRQMVWEGQLRIQDQRRTFLIIGGSGEPSDL